MRTLMTIRIGRVQIHALQFVGTPVVILAWEAAALYLRRRDLREEAHA